MADDHAKPPATLADITTKLRRHADIAKCNGCMICTAADEIERLREKVQDLQMYLEQDACEIERLRTFIDQWHQERMQLFGQILLLEEELSDAYDACRYALAGSPRWEALAETVVHTWEVNHGRQ